jgi:hypothetical protein
MYEKLAYPYCIKHNKSFALINSGKHFFHCHQRFFPSNQKYIKNIKDFFVGRVKRDVALPIPLYE